MTKKKTNPFKENRHEIAYKLINSFMAGGFVFCGSLATAGTITLDSFYYSAIASILVFITKFQNYWKTQESEYTKNLFNFIN